ncbi:MAG: glutamate--cysteine ligase [Alphaproteobacteria bacterium]
MSVPVTATGGPITSKQQLIDYIAGGSRPREEWRIGTEHEKFAFRIGDRRRLEYDGRDGIRALLEGLQKRFGWQPIREGETLIGLVDGKGATISLEPGGQVELSGAPLENLHQTCGEVGMHLTQVKEIGAELGIGMIGLGFDPKWRREDVPWMPKGRYRIMRAYMPKKGGQGLDMMLRTCTVQVNLDFSSEADMVKKFRVALALQPLATALFANSPFKEGQPSGYVSWRGQVWTDTDPDRTGIPAFVFEPSFGFERWVDWILDIPMYFVYREGHYIDASGQSFKDFLNGSLPALPGQKPLLSDFADHMTTAFPEVRLKRYLEMRGADGGPWSRLCALPAFWVGLLYDDASLDAAWDLVKGWSQEERENLRREAPRLGLGAAVGIHSLRDLGREILELAKQGLVRRARRGNLAENETQYLEPLHRVIETGNTLADDLLMAYRTRWNGSIDPVFQEFAY